jgi:hypothetical protein
MNPLSKSKKAMKSWFIGLFIISLFACDRKAEVTPDPFYDNRWQLSSTQTPGQPPVSIGPSGYIQFTRDGKILYDGKDNSTLCCAPTRFTRSGDVLTYTETVSCPHVDCLFASSGKIVSIDTNLTIETTFTPDMKRIAIYSRTK